MFPPAIRHHDNCGNKNRAVKLNIAVLGTRPEISNDLTSALPTCSWVSLFSLRSSLNRSQNIRINLHDENITYCEGCQVNNLFTLRVKISIDRLYLKGYDLLVGWNITMPLHLFGGKMRDRIRIARLTLRKTQIQLAEEMGVCPNTIASWESGDRTPPTRKLVALCAALGISLDYLLTGKNGWIRKNAPLAATKANSSRWWTWKRMLDTSQSRMRISARTESKLES